MVGDLHIKLTMILLFINIVLALTVPDQVMMGNYFFEESGDKYIISGDISEAAADIQTQRSKGVSSQLGFLDIISLIWGVIDLLLRLFFASIIICFTLPSVISLLVGVPIVIAYLLAIVGWFK